MDIRRESAVCAAGLLLSAMTATASAQAATQTTGQGGSEDRTPITLVGCVQRESDYRKMNDSGRGGVAGTGLGRGNEYVLINASAGAPTGNIDCASGTTAAAYELTGSGEKDLEQYVGRVVQINGMLKRAETEPVGTSGATRPTGGVDPLGQDLRLHEVNVTSFQEYTARNQTPERTQAAATPEPSFAPSAAPARAEPQGEPAQQELPRTASPFPAAGLLGLISLGAAAGIRALRRR
jgi:hypothetical protein